MPAANLEPDNCIDIPDTNSQMGVKMRFCIRFYKNKLVSFPILFIHTTKNHFSEYVSLHDTDIESMLYRFAHRLLLLIKSYIIDEPCTL